MLSLLSFSAGIRDSEAGRSTCVAHDADGDDAKTADERPGNDCLVRRRREKRYQEEKKNLLGNLFY